MSHRFLTSMMSMLLLSCAASPKPVEDIPLGPRRVSTSGASKAPVADAPKATATAASKSEPAAPRDAKVATTEHDEDWPPQDFSGVDTTAPVDEETNDKPQEVEVKGIEGTTSRYDVRTTLENRAQDFDACHDRMGGSGGRIVFRIHILENGDVGGLKVHPMKVRNRKLVDCYAEVVSTSHFNRPHGGYADVKWTTKVGRSPKRPDALFERKGRWDTPAGGGAKSASRKTRKRTGA